MQWGHIIRCCDVEEEEQARHHAARLHQAFERHAEARSRAHLMAHLGDGAIAYIKPIRSEDAARLFPQIGDIQPGVNLFALLSADGTPIMLTDSKDAAIANAWENELQTVSVH
jgi:hypothetical protein